MADHISDAVVRRLPGYYRHLRELEQEGINQVSSQELGARMGQTPSFVRQDLNSVGGFGRQGYGYDVTRLKEGIGHVLGLDRTHTMIIIGAGSIGSAVARYPGFLKEGFITIGMFDTSPERVGSTVGDMAIRDMKELDRFVADNTVDIAVLAVPASAAREIAKQVVDLGIMAIWNFAPVDLKVPDTPVKIVNAHLSDSLQVLSFLMTSGEIE